MLSMAWEKWQFEAEALARQRYMALGALKRMRFYKMSQAWEKWQYTAAMMKEHERLIRKGLSIFRLRRLRASWNHWYAIGLEGGKQRRMQEAMARTKKSPD